MIFRRLQFLAMAVALAMPATAHAQLATYIGFDAGANAPGTNAIASRNAFLAATGGAVQVDFEAGLPTDPTFSGTTFSRRRVARGSGALYGANTTPDGQWFLEQSGGTLVMNFAAPLDFFGAYFGGIQFTNTLTFTDLNGSQTVTFPTNERNGGFAFIGFTSAGSRISSIILSSRSDVMSMDDMIFGGSRAFPPDPGTPVGTVPEPGILALLMVGLGMLGVARTRAHQRV